MLGKCPKCEKLLSYVSCSAVDVKVAFGTSWNGISHNCPFCHTVLGVQIDPIAIKTDIVNELLNKLQGRHR
jgi:hypothetical protein